MSNARTVEERGTGYVYDSFERGLWTVGFYDPQGKWRPESDHDSEREAADRVHFLNGGNALDADPRVTALVEAARDCARTMDNWAENALTQREALEAVSVRNILTAALKPFTEK